MLVDMWMTRDPITIPPGAAISEAALVMARQHIRRLVVVDPRHDRGVAGMVSASDVARAFPPDVNPASAMVTEASAPAPVATIMTRTVQTIDAGAGIDEAARRMRRDKIGALPVLRGGRLVGILTESDVFRALVEMSDPGAAGVRITFELADDEELLPTVTSLCAAHPFRVGSLFSFRHHDTRDGRVHRLGVVRLVGDAPPELLDALWRSHHRVLAVVPCPSERA